MTTLIPSTDLCKGGGQSLLYGIAPFTGCSNGDAIVITDNGKPKPLAISFPPGGLNSSSGDGRAIQTTEGRQTEKVRSVLLGNPEGKPVTIGGVKTSDVISGRLSWRELVDQ
jgi:Tfp pilus tip-associated adhesin PilY1